MVLMVVSLAILYLHHDTMCLYRRRLPKTRCLLLLYQQVTAQQAEPF